MKNNYTQKELDRFFEDFKRISNSVSINKVHQLINDPSIKAKYKLKHRNTLFMPILITSIIILAISAFLFYFTDLSILKYTEGNSTKGIHAIEVKKVESSYLLKPYENLKQIDNLLNSISQPSQIYMCPSNACTKVIGSNGTIIHVNPRNLNTIDSTLLGDSIRVELIEMFSKPSLIKHNAQTISNGKPLITGGAYYLNMTSNNKQLQVNNKGIDIEFPKLSDSKMELFMGERDSLNQMNWKPVNKRFKTKKLHKPVEPVLKPEFVIEVQSSRQDYDISLQVPDELQKPKEVKKEDSSNEAYKIYKHELAEYKKKKREFDLKRRTYESIKILEFGWINCDKFVGINSPKTNINIDVVDSTIVSAKFFCVFKDMQSILFTNYLSSRQTNKFRNIPENYKVKILGLALKDTIPYWFEEDIVVNQLNHIRADFTPSNLDEIKSRIEGIQ